MSTTVSDLKTDIREIGKAAKTAARIFANATTDQKNRLLETIAEKLEVNTPAIQEANGVDLEKGRSSGLSKAMLDRLDLNDKRMASMIQGLRDIIALPDPVGNVDKTWTRPNGLELQKVRVPLGVIGIIFESRPNVTIDASALCLKSGNVTILRGGKEAIESNKALGRSVSEAALECGLPPAVVTVIPTTDRAAIPVMCGMNEYLDLIIPRGGRGLIETVVEHARMPVIKHYDGICHVYIHEKANLEMAVRLIVNAKTQRPGVCNAAETLLVDASVAPKFLPLAAKVLREKGVTLLGDAGAGEALGETLKEPENWRTEYLDLILAVRVVDGMDQAIDHIETYGSHHSDAIVTEDGTAAERFLSHVDSSAVFWNASTRFNDGAAFGFGAEIGISTDKLHARGPMALEELTSYKYLVRGSGQIIE